MQDTPTTSTLRDNILTFLAWFLSGSFITTVVTWLLNRRKTTAEVLEIHATAAKIEVEAREASVRTILAAQARIVELVDINGELQVESSEACRQRDNFEFELGRANHTIAQMQIEQKLDKQFIEQLEAANKLGLRLRDLPNFKRLPLEVQQLLMEDKYDAPTVPGS